VVRQHWGSAITGDWQAGGRQTRGEQRIDGEIEERQLPRTVALRQCYYRGKGGISVSVSVARQNKYPQPDGIRMKSREAPVREGQPRRLCCKALPHNAPNCNLPLRRNRPGRCQPRLCKNSLRIPPRFDNRRIETNNSSAIEPTCLKMPCTKLVSSVFHGLGHFQTLRCQPDLQKPDRRPRC
jgi:hypothetical protein